MELYSTLGSFNLSAGGASSGQRLAFHFLQQAGISLGTMRKSKDIISELYR